MTNKNGAPVYFVTQTNPEIFEATPRPGGIAKIDIPPKRSRLRENAAKTASTTGLKSKTSIRSSIRPSLRKSQSKAARMKPTEKKDEPAATSTPSRKSLLTITSIRTDTKELDVDSCPRQFKVKQIIAATPWSVEFDEYLEPTEESKRIPDPFQDSVDMLAMSISVIMLLSRGYGDISDTHFKWVLSYLECIRDEFGQVPPNVQGILNHINEITGSRLKSFLEDDDFEPIELGPTSIRISTAPPTIVEPASQTEPPAEEEG